MHKKIFRSNSIRHLYRAAVLSSPAVTSHSVPVNLHYSVRTHKNGVPTPSPRLCSLVYPYWCPGLEVYPRSCSSLPPRSLLSHPGHQRSQFTPLIGTGVTLCSFCSYLHNTGRAFSVVGPSVWYMGFLWRNDCSPVFFLTHFTLALLSSNFEEALYKSPQRMNELHNLYQYAKRM